MDATQSIAVSSPLAARTAGRMQATLRVNWSLMEAADALPADLRPGGNPSGWPILGALVELSAITEGHLPLVQEQLRKSRDQRLARNKVKGREAYITATDVNAARRFFSKKALPTPAEMVTPTRDPDAPGFTTMMADLTSPPSISRKRSRSPEGWYENTVFGRLSKISKTSGDSFQSAARSESPEGTSASRSRVVTFAMSPAPATRGRSVDGTVFDHTKFESSSVNTDQPSRKRGRSSDGAAEHATSRPLKISKTSGEPLKTATRSETRKGLMSDLFDSSGFIASTPKAPTAQNVQKTLPPNHRIQMPPTLSAKSRVTPHSAEGPESETRQTTMYQTITSTVNEETSDEFADAQTSLHKEKGGAAQQEVQVPKSENSLFDPFKYIGVDPEVVRYGTIGDQIILLELRDVSLETLLKMKTAEITNERANIRYMLTLLKIKNRIRLERAANTTE